MPNIEALQTLLPQIKKQEGQWPDELLGKFLVATLSFDGSHETVETETITLKDGKELKYFKLHAHECGGHASFIWQEWRSQCPDVDLTAANKLCGELGYKRQSGDCDLGKFALVYSTTPDPVHADARHPTNERTAILTALALALIAEGGG